MQREKLGSRLGFILLSAGCAIGLGNVWKFPWLVGQNGGAFFVLIYLLFLVAMGVPIMTMEFAVGRAAQKSPARMYHEVTPEKKGWRIHGYASVVGVIMLMMFYTMVAGWMIHYFVEMVINLVPRRRRPSAEEPHNNVALRHFGMGLLLRTITQNNLVFISSIFL